MDVRNEHKNEKFTTPQSTAVFCQLIIFFLLWRPEWTEWIDKEKEKEKNTVRQTANDVIVEYLCDVNSIEKINFTHMRDCATLGGPPNRWDQCRQMGDVVRVHILSDERGSGFSRCCLHRMLLDWFQKSHPLGMTYIARICASTILCVMLLIIRMMMMMIHAWLLMFQNACEKRHKVRSTAVLVRSISVNLSIASNAHFREI